MAFFGWNRKKTDPEILEHLGGRLLDAVDFCVLDCEMTGLDPNRHEIISIGAVRICKGRIMMSSRFYRLVQPEHPDMSRDNLLIHRIRPQALEGGLPAAQAFCDFLEYADQAVLVGHGVGFDLRFLKALARRLGRDPMTLPALDTMLLARWHVHFQDRHKVLSPGNQMQLAHLSDQHRVPQFQHHHAFFDALTTACLFRRQWDQLHQAGYYTFADLYRIARAG